MRKTIVFLLAVTVCTQACFAKNLSNKLQKSWGGGSLNICGAHDLNENSACIGASAAVGCKKIHDEAIEARTSKYKNHQKEYAIQMLAAVDVTEQGARFCPFQIEGKNRDSIYTIWLEYTQLDTAGCVWLCRDGWTGEGCNTPSNEVSTCDINELQKKNYEDIQRVDNGTNDEDAVGRFIITNQPRPCKSNENKTGGGVLDDHNIILVIKNWLPDGHGAIVQQMTVRAAHKTKDDTRHHESWVQLYPASGAGEIVACKNGYKPDATLKDCVAINKDLCGESENLLNETALNNDIAEHGYCSGFNQTEYNSDIHTLLTEGTGENYCYKYSCKEHGKAFLSENDKTCIECPYSKLSGVNTKTNVCVKCETGYYFDDNTYDCRKAQSITKSDLQYGIGKTNRSNTDVSRQCWTKVTPSEYKACIGIR